MDEEEKAAAIAFANAANAFADLCRALTEVVVKVGNPIAEALVAEMDQERARLKRGR